MRRGQAPDCPRWRTTACHPNPATAACRTALIVGGTGLVGQAVARRLLGNGWAVSVTGRSSSHMPADLADAGVRFIPAERNDAATLAAAVGSGVDLLVDCICYTARQAELLVPMVRQTASTVTISSKAVYVDDAGRHANSHTRPRFTAPVTEAQPTMAPGSMDHMSPQGYTVRTRWPPSAYSSTAGHRSPCCDPSYFTGLFDYLAEDRHLT